MSDQSRPVDDANPFGHLDGTSTETVGDAELGPESDGVETFREVRADWSPRRGLRRGRRVRRGAKGQLIFHL